MSLPLLYALLRPFGLCAEYLATETIERYLLPGCRFVLSVLEGLTDAELKREVVFEGKNDFITGIVKFSRALLTRVPGQESLLNELEMARLKIILRVLQISSFNGKMNALNEINRVLSYVSIYPHRGLIAEEEGGDFLSAGKMAQWIRSNRVLAIVLNDSLHQSQYVEKLEKILRFLIKEKALSFDDLDAVWNAQEGKHEAIAKNVHDLLAKLAWDFSADQLDHLFRCFQTSMQRSGNKKQRERLLELNRRLAEDDKNGMMAQKVLNMFWNLAHSPDTPLEVLEQALQSHVKILDYSCSQERDAQKGIWLVKCVEELKGRDEWVLPALRLIRDICSLYDTTPNHTPRMHHTMNRQKIIDQLQNDHKLVILVTNSLTGYMGRVRALVAADPTLKPAKLLLDGRYAHPQQIQERLDFLKFLLKDGHLWLCADQAKQIWNALAVSAAFASDREECFRWFSKLMGENPDLDPGINRDFFENNLLKLDPLLLTESGVKCFERFFRAVNTKEDRLMSMAKVHHHRGRNRNESYSDEQNRNEYLWRVITTAAEPIANRAIGILNDMVTAIGPRTTVADVQEYHEAFIEECCEKLRATYQSIELLSKIAQEGKERDDENGAADSDIERKKLALAEQMCRIVRTLQEYIRECDRKFVGDRYDLPLCHFVRGRHIELLIKFQTPGRQLDDVEVLSHSNETMHSLKRNILRRIKALKANEIRVDLYDNVTGELVMVPDEQQTLAFYGIRDKMSLSAKLTPVTSGMMATGSPDSSSDSSSGSPPRNYDDPIKQQQQLAHHGFAQSLLQQQQQQQPQQQQSQYMHAGHPQRGESLLPGRVAGHLFWHSGSESEDILPGVIIAQKPHYTEFFLKLYQLASELKDGRLMDSVRSLLHLLPLDRQTMSSLYELLGIVKRVRTKKAGDTAKQVDASQSEDVIVLGDNREQQSDISVALMRETFRALFVAPTPVRVLYNLEVLEAMLLPATIVPPPAIDDGVPYGQLVSKGGGNNGEMGGSDGGNVAVTGSSSIPIGTLISNCNSSMGSVGDVEKLLALLEFQYAWIGSGVAYQVVGLLTEPSFLGGAGSTPDSHTTRATFRCVLRLVRFLLYTLGYLRNLQFFYVFPRFWPLHGALWGGEQTLKSFAKRLTLFIHEVVEGPEGSGYALVEEMYASKWCFPDMECMKNVLEIALRAANGWCQPEGDPWSVQIPDVMKSDGTTEQCHKASDGTDGSTEQRSGTAAALDGAKVDDDRKRRNSTSSIGSCGSSSSSSSSSDSSSATTHSDTKGNGAQTSAAGNTDLAMMRPPNDVSGGEPSVNYEVCQRALEVLSLAFALNEEAMLKLVTGTNCWDSFLLSLLVVNPSARVRAIAHEQLLTMLTDGNHSRLSQKTICKMRVIWEQLNHNFETNADFLQLFAKLVQYSSLDTLYPTISTSALLHDEIKWLYWVKGNVAKHGNTLVHEDILEGHLCLTRALVYTVEQKDRHLLVPLLMDLLQEFVFKASFQYIDFRRQKQIHFWETPPVCRSPKTVSAAMELLVELCHGSIEFTRIVAERLNDMFFSDIEPVREWEYLPPDAPRALHGFCGLKNAGATCYMNSVLQQLYMVPALRNGLVTVHKAVVDEREDFNEDQEQGQCLTVAHKGEYGGKRYDIHTGETIEDSYHIGILRYVTVIFCYLGHSALQYYVPKGLWRHFKLQGEPVNLREQQDAVEFFMSLFESIDEGLKELNCKQLMSATLGGCFSDQKICQDCPHRYSKDEPFSVLSVDIRNHSSLTDSLEQYVRGEILEGADAYHCDKCDKKVVTVKRLCVSKLPPVLAIQLKRFEYDYERVCAIKYNDYFEFPRVLDMDPYTVSGLAKLEGEVINVEPKQEEQGSTRYHLTGIVVHSGQASGGHYYSYILHKNYANGQKKWYKFDDGEVTECKMDDDEEMKAQCFGGDYMGEVYDNNLKRMQYRRQKRWWNAYMLFYTRNDVYYAKPPKNAFWWPTGKAGLGQVPTTPTVETLSLAQSEHYSFEMAPTIERCIRSQNLRFLHSRMLFSVEFFTFMKKFTEYPDTARRTLPSWLPKQTKDSKWDEICLLKVQLASQFLFHSGFKTKKTIRGQVMDWYEIFRDHLEESVIIRQWFAQNVLLDPPSRLCEYLLAAPLPEIRSCFAKLVVSFCHYSAKDEPLSGYDGSNLCEQVLVAVLALLKTDVPEHGKHLPHYFSLFSMYAGLGYREKYQLIKLNVPVLFMKVAMDDGTGPSIKYQYPDLGKLHHVVSLLVRSMDISSRCAAVRSTVLRHCPTTNTRANPPTNEEHEKAP
uniref:ubiquitinyl hydrolase 1 n=1 Tax=Anopheles darlingi TaxID=43151 RepID=A0A2M4DNF9_ANODA